MVLLGFLVFGVVVGIAALFVIREARRLAVEPIPPTYSLDEAYDWVVEHLPDVVAATLTPDDVRRILALQVEFFERRGVARNGHSPRIDAADVVIGDVEVVGYVIERAATTGDEYLPEQVHAVVATQMEYLIAIGALRRAPDDPA
jgi:hypothetical protein